MEEKKVEVIQANENAVMRKRRKKLEGNTLTIMRKRVAAYVRVSTDGAEQLQSFQSQKQYYQDKISKNRDWSMVGIYADEAITGTKTDKRDGFVNMINDCMNDQIDVVITKSISRFSRNLEDTLHYTRMLKQKGITVIFEKENIDTSTMESEMQLALLSAIAQNEVESLSQNVKMGVQMKMSRGEMMGFNGCLGYDYHQEDKSISINEKEAEIVRMIYDLYLQGYGSYTIVKQLTALGKTNKKGEVKWTVSGVMGILKNEKYKGDLLLGKTFTVDPISKRRLENCGESNQYYVKDHHPPIITKETWEKAQEIRKRRYRPNCAVSEQTRTAYTKKYAFSSMCQCGFCGKNLTRRSHNQDTKHRKPVWKCTTASRDGIKNCPNSKSIDEVIIENAFLEMLRLLSENFDDILDCVLQTVEEVMAGDESMKKIKRLVAEISKLEKKQNKLTDIMLDDKISRKGFEEKYEELERKIRKAKAEKEILSRDNRMQQDINDRMKLIRAKITDAEIFDQFDRVVFESIVEKIIVGEKMEGGGVDPYKLTFVLKCSDAYVVRDARERYRNYVK